MNINETFTDEMMKLCQRYEVEIIINNDINSLVVVMVVNRKVLLLENLKRNKFIQFILLVN